MVLFDIAALKIAMCKAKLGVGVTSLCGSPPPSNSFDIILSNRIPIAKLSLCPDITSRRSPLQTPRLKVMPLPPDPFAGMKTHAQFKIVTPQKVRHCDSRQ